MFLRNRGCVAMPHYGTPAMDAKYPCDTKDNILKAIAHEKRIELKGEEICNRDIPRWRVQSKLSKIYASVPINYFLANKFELLPIPQNTIDSNPNVGQTNLNPGY